MTFKHQEKETLNIFAVLAVSLSTVIAMLDSTIANVALPVIAKDFGVSESASIMIINAYQFAVVASLMPFAALGRAVGNKKIFIAGADHPCRSGQRRSAGVREQLSANKHFCSALSGRSFFDCDEERQCKRSWAPVARSPKSWRVN